MPRAEWPLVGPGSSWQRQRIAALPIGGAPIPVEHEGLACGKGGKCSIRQMLNKLARQFGDRRYESRHVKRGIMKRDFVIVRCLPRKEE